MAARKAAQLKNSVSAQPLGTSVSGCSGRLATDNKTLATASDGGLVGGVEPDDEREQEPTDGYRSGQGR